MRHGKMIETVTEKNLNPLSPNLFNKKRKRERLLVLLA